MYISVIALIILGIANVQHFKIDDRYAFYIKCLDILKLQGDFIPYIPVYL